MSATQDPNKLRAQLRRERARVRELKQQLKTKPATTTSDRMHIVRQEQQPTATAQPVAEKKPSLTMKVFDAVVEYMRDEVAVEIDTTSKAA